MYTAACFNFLNVVTVFVKSFLHCHDYIVVKGNQERWSDTALDPKTGDFSSAQTSATPVIPVFKPLLVPVCPSNQEWFTIYEHNRRPSCTVSDLVMGNEYSFRVFSENICGLSEVPGISKNTAVITKTGEGIRAELCKRTVWPLVANTYRAAGKFIWNMSWALWDVTGGLRQECEGNGDHQGTNIK